MPDCGNGKICYLELPAKDIQASADFYTKIFGWKMRKRGDGATAFDDGVNQVSGAFVTDREPSSNPGLLIYVMVDDAGKTVRDIEAIGGEIVQPIGVDHPEITARFKDPSGNILGIYQEPK